MVLGFETGALFQRGIGDNIHDDTFFQFGAAQLIPPSHLSSWAVVAASYQALDAHTPVLIVNLPNDVTITEAVVYGDTATDIWNLGRMTVQTGIVTWIANAVINTVDPSHHAAYVDNEKYTYFIQIGCAINAILYGGFVRYVR